MITRLKAGALAATCALFLVSTPVLAGNGNDGDNQNGNGCDHDCGHHNAGVPLPLAGVGLVALAAGGFVLRRRMKKAQAE